MTSQVIVTLLFIVFRPSQRRSEAADVTMATSDVTVKQMATHWLYDVTGDCDVAVRRISPLPASQ